MKRAIVAFALCLMLATRAWAGIEEGVEAYNRGEYITALLEIRTLAEQGDKEGQVAFGIMYEDGLALSQDYTKAVYWYRKAAEQNGTVAQGLLGVMYEKGRGVPQDYSVAVKWYFKAAEQGDAHAQHNLGVMYEKGRGVSQDYVAAHMWINLAVSRFAPGERRDKAVNERDIIAKHMTPAQITVAQRLARDWQPSQRNVEPLPIAVPAFQGSTAEEKAYGRKVTEVITDNLQLSGLFHAFSGAEFIRQSPDEFGIQPRFADWRLINAQALVTGRAELTPDGLLVVEFRLWDVFAQQQLKGNRYRTVPENWQEVAHKIADEVYQRIVGSATPRRAPGPPTASASPVSSATLHPWATIPAQRTVSSARNPAPPSARFRLVRGCLSRASSPTASRPRSGRRAVPSRAQNQRRRVP